MQQQHCYDADAFFLPIFTLTATQKACKRSYHFVALLIKKFHKILEFISINETIGYFERLLNMEIVYCKKTLLSNGK